MTVDCVDRGLFCDVTQSWSAVGGGVGTYLRRKRDYILAHTPHRHLLIVPGAEDGVEEDGRAITVTIASPPVPTSPKYRLLLRNRAVRAALAKYRPHVVECQDAYNLPWAVFAHRRRYPETAAVAVYMTDFPTAYVHRPLKQFVGNAIAGQLRSLAYRYCGLLYRRFDAVFALSENGGAAKLRQLGVGDVDIVPLAVKLDHFSPRKRDPELRRSLGIGPDEPFLIYVGRLDKERRAQVVVDAFNRLPPELGAHLALLGDGSIREGLVEGSNGRIIAPGYLADRNALAKWLASADIYVSAMADETFGVSVIEAQASGLPVVGVAAGAMLDRVDQATGRLGPVDDAKAMARNIVEVWNSDRAAMGKAARAHVAANRFTWDDSFDHLFNDVYRRAIEARRVEVERSAPRTYAKGLA